MKQKVKAVSLCIVAILVLIIAQLVAMTLGAAFTMLGLPECVEVVTDAIAYPILTILGLKLFVEKVFKYSLKDFGVKKPQFKWYWIAIGLLLPVFVIGLFQFVDGGWVIYNTDMGNKVVIVFWGVLYYSLAAGIVEEMIFRGVIMGVLKKEFNLPIAIWVPSVLFGLVHIIGNSLDFISMIQLVIAGTFVGVMFSLIGFQSDNFWNNAIMHAFWNMSTIGLCHIGLDVSENSLFTYVINTKSTIISGGDFGIESSVFAIAGYGIVCILALIMIKKRDITLK